MSNKEEMALELSEKTLGVLERRAAEKGFESTESYVTVIVESVLNELEQTEKENDSVENRLKDLGYL